MTTQLLEARRAFLAQCSALGVGATLLPGVLWAKVAAGAEIDKATIAAAEEIAGVSFTDEERELMLAAVRRQAQQIAALHAVPVDNAVAPAVSFNPLLRPDALPKASSGRPGCHASPAMPRPQRTLTSPMRP